MPIATDEQVQDYVDQRVRPHSELMRDLYNSFNDDKALLDDVYSALTQETPTWNDVRDDAPPHLMSPGDVLAWNAFVSALIAFIEGDGAANFAKVRQACVRPA